MGWFGVSSGDRWEPPSGAEIREATPAEAKAYYRSHAAHGCTGAAPYVWKGNVLTGYYPECPNE